MKYVFELLFIAIIVFANLVCSSERSNSPGHPLGFLIGTECDDQAVSAVAMDDRHYLVLGRSSNCNSDYNSALKVYIAKTNLFGDTIWNCLIQDSISLYPTGIAVAENGEIIICGNTRSNYSSASSPLFLIKTDAEGHVIWKKQFPSVEGGQSVKIASDGNYVVSTNTVNYGEAYRIGLVKFDTSGTLLWEKQYERDRWETSIGMELFSSGCLLVTNYYYGYTTSENYSYFFRTDLNGDTLWSKILDSINVNNIYKDNDSNYILVGSNYKTILYQSIYTVQLRKIDSFGHVLLSNSVYVNRYNLINSVVQTSDSSFLLAGTWNGSKPILMKWNRQGKWLWTKLIEGRDWASDYRIYPAGGQRYFLVGTSGSEGEVDIHIIPIDENGNPEIER